MDKLHYYVCLTDELLAKYVKIAEVDSGHILELDKTMENMRFMRNMDDHYANESDNEEDVKDDVEYIHPGDKLVNYFNESIMTIAMMMTMKKKMMIMIGTRIIMTTCMVMPIKGQDSLLQAYYMEAIVVGKYFNFTIVSFYKLICCNQLCLFIEHRNLKIDWNMTKRRI
jgi:hypothetical protein